MMSNESSDIHMFVVYETIAKLCFGKVRIRMTFCCPKTDRIKILSNMTMSDAIIAET